MSVCGVAASGVSPADSRIVVTDITDAATLAGRDADVELDGAAGFPTVTVVGGATAPVVVMFVLLLAVEVLSSAVTDVDEVDVADFDESCLEAGLSTKSKQVHRPRFSGSVVSTLTILNRFLKS